jgi:hypothetical protein
MLKNYNNPKLIEQHNIIVCLKNRKN